MARWSLMLLCAGVVACSEPQYVRQPDAAAADAGPDGAVPDGSTGTGACDRAPYPCDPLATCEERPGNLPPVCGDCPPGFLGSGFDACYPALTGLTSSVGVWAPSFAPEATAYTLVTGMAPSSLRLTPSAPGNVMIRLGEVRIPSGTPSDSIGLLPYEQRDLKLVLSATNDQLTEVDVRVARTWLNAERLSASNAETGDWYGSSVAISGDYIAVGALNEGSAGVTAPDLNEQLASGAVYVLRRTPTVMEAAFVKAGYPLAGNAFGTSLALSGDTLVVGEPQEPGRATGIGQKPVQFDAFGSGAVWVYERMGPEWVESAYIKSSNNGEGDTFGDSVDFDGEWLIVGAPGEASGIPGNELDDSVAGAGAAYVFRRVAGVFEQVAYLKPAEPREYMGFGLTVATSGGYFAVGARYEDGAAPGVNGDQTMLTKEDSGAVYVYRVEDDEVVFDAYLKPQVVDAGDGFGWSVALSGANLVVGAPQEASASPAQSPDPTSNGAEGSGAAYVFTRGAGGWKQTAYLKSSRPRVAENFGRRVAYCGSRVVVAAPDQNSSWELLPTLADESGQKSGALFVFEGGEGPFALAAVLKPPPGALSPRIGSSVACDATTIAAGARGDMLDAENPQDSAGAVYLFK